MTLTGTQMAEYQRADTIRRQREAAAEAEETRRESAAVAEREAVADALDAARRAAGITLPDAGAIRDELRLAEDEDAELASAQQTITRIERRQAARREAARAGAAQPSGEGFRSGVAALQDEDDQLAEARAVVQRVERKRVGRRQSAEEALRADLYAQAAGARARAQLPGFTTSYGTAAAGVPLADGLYAELADGGQGVTPLARSVRAALPHAVTRSAVAEVLELAGIDPVTGAVRPHAPVLDLGWDGRGRCSAGVR